MKKYRRRHTIESMREFAQGKGGRCLSDSYVNSKTHLLWECSEGHKWEATSSNILQGKWCPICAGNTQLTIDVFRKVAIDRGGRLITEKYSSLAKTMEWECAKGHRWFATGNNVKNHNTWCAECSGHKRLDVSDMVELATRNGGEFLSKTYTNLASKYQWRCKEGHEWEASAYSIRIVGVWCPVCTGKISYNLDDLKEHAKKLEGRIHSKEYVNMDSKYNWECKHGHKWNATWYKIKNGQWCPRCSTNNIKEEKVRICFEALFNEQFPKSFPKFLLNSDGNQMEYDGYSKKLKIAFEYHGKQHFQLGYFTKTKEELDKRIRDDDEKVKQSERNGVRLLVLTYKDSEETFKDRIIELSKENGISHLLNKDVEPEYYLAYLAHNRFEELFKLVESKNGELLSEKWEGGQAYYKVRCKLHDHNWSTTGRALLEDGTWCRKCGRVQAKKSSYENRYKELVDYAKEHNGTLISKEYKGQYHTYEFLCVKGHQVKIPWKNRVKKKYFCRICEESKLNQRSFIERAKELHANKYNYSKTIYVKASDKVIIECPIHGEFLKTPHKHISSKQGCPQCSSQRRTAMKS